MRERRRKVSAGKAHTFRQCAIKPANFSSPKPIKIYSSPAVCDAHTHIIRTVLFFALSIYNIGRCWNSALQNRKQWTGIYWQKQSYGGRWEIHKEQCLLSYSRADRRQISPEQQERESLTSPEECCWANANRGAARKYIICAHRLQESYQNCCLSECVAVWLEIQFQTSTASAPACIGMRKLMCVRLTNEHDMLNYHL